MSNALLTIDEMFREECLRNELNPFEYLDFYDEGIEVYDSTGDMVETKNFFREELGSFFKVDEYAELYEEDRKEDYRFPLHWEE